MPASKALFIFIIVGVIAAAGIFTFIPSMRPAVVNSWIQKSKGFTLAKTPDEALDKFRKAIKERDYESAKLYVAGDYLEQLKLGGEAGNKLGTAIDALTYTFKETKKLKSDKVEFALRLIDPFPPVFEVRDVKKSGDDKATALLEFKYGQTVNPGYMADWKYDQNINMALTPAEFWPQLPVELRKEGTGKEEAWRILFPVTPALRKRVTTLQDYYGNFVQAMNRLNDDLKNNPSTIDNFERELKNELESAKK
jgi:hypothetical protein